MRSEDRSTIVHSRAPVRIDLAGGWTDVPPFAEREGGLVVNLALRRYAHVTLAMPADGISIRSDDYHAAVEAATIDGLRYDGTLDLAKAALRRMQPDRDLALAMRSDAPPGSGLGTSAAMGVALVGALNALKSDPLTPSGIAALAVALEIEELRIAGGKQDQLAAVYGGAQLHTFGPHDPRSTPLHLRRATLAALEQRLVLCYSGVSRLSGDIIARVQAAYAANEPATCNALRTMRDLARSMADALQTGKLDQVGPLLRENWICQRALHPSVTNADVDRLFAIAEQHGASGGKACGAGGGGCLVFCCDPDALTAVGDALQRAGATLLPVAIDVDGLRVTTQAADDANAA